MRIGARWTKLAAMNDETDEFALVDTRGFWKKALLGYERRLWLAGRAE